MKHRTDASQLAIVAAGARPCAAMRPFAHEMDSAAATLTAGTWSFSTKRGNGYTLKQPARHLGTPPT